MAQSTPSPGPQQAATHHAKQDPTHTSHIFTIPHHSSSSNGDREPEEQRPNGSPPQEDPEEPEEEPQQKQQPQQQQQEQPRDLPEIAIPRIPPVTASQPPPVVTTGLVGRYVDEFGNILDWDGTVLGQAGGDLPSMIGRPVTANGEILDEDGQVAGYVSENYTQPAMRPLTGDLKVDDSGIIYDRDGKPVGKLNARPATEQSSGGGPAGTLAGLTKAAPAGESSSGSAGKPSAAPNPNEIYLDVKSTYDGIQIILKIPTVFNGKDKDGSSKEGGHEEGRR